MLIDDPQEVASITDVVNMRDTRKNEDQISLKGEFKRIEYVRFDDRKVIGKIVDIAFTKEFIFVILSHGGGVMKYDRQGNFVRHIAWEGEGPKQVYTPHHLFVDELRERIYVMQYNKKSSVSVYSFDGTFLGYMEYPFDKASFVYHLSDEVFFAFHGSGLLSDSLNYGSGIFDNSGRTYFTLPFSTTLLVGQAVLSEVDLANKLGYDKKTISRVLDKMSQLEIVVSTQSNRTSIHTLKCISAWIQNGNRIDNPFYVRLKDRLNERENTPTITVPNRRKC